MNKSIIVKHQAAKHFTEKFSLLHFTFSAFCSFIPRPVQRIGSWYPAYMHTLNWYIRYLKLC